MKGRGTREQIVNVRQIIEKSREFNTPFLMCFIDYSKAFDCVKWDCLWTILKEMGVPQHLIALIANLYQDGQSVVKVNDIVSGSFKPERGVRQGCILSPILFNIYGEYIMRKALEDWKGGISVGGLKISNLRYADDTTLFASSEKELAELFHKVEHESELVGLTVNKTKTKVMLVDRTGQLSRTGELSDLELVNDFVYLGSLITNQGGSEREIRRRTQMAKAAMSKLTRIWQNRKVSNVTKMRLVRTLIFSIFLYGSESWTIRAIDRKKIDAFEMWCWRRMLRIPWTAKRTNKSILDQLGIKTRLSAVCYQRILGYFGHIARRQPDNLDKLVVVGKVEGKRPRGRSPSRWCDQVTTHTGLSVTNAMREAENRSRWKEITKRALKAFQGHDLQQ